MEYETTAVPAIQDFITEDGNWRIDCLGDLTYPRKPGLESQPSVSVALSKAKFPMEKMYFASTGSTNTYEQKTENIPVGLLPLLTLGDFWSGGQRSCSPTNYKTHTFNNLTINENTCTTIHLGRRRSENENIQDKPANYYLPIEEHPYHKKFTRAQCEKIVTTDGKTVVLIPHWEIIRFYFGSSNKLLEALFGGGSPLNRLYDEDKSHAPDREGRAHIHVRAGIPEESIPHVARIAFCPSAKAAAMSLGASLIKQGYNKTKVYPKTSMPISGITDLKMKGKFISYGNHQSGFICYEIVHCTASAPFTYLSHFKDLPGDTNPNRDYQTLEPLNIVKAKNPKSKNSEQIQQADANSIYDPKKHKYTTNNAFAFLNKITIEKVRKTKFTHCTTTKIIDAEEPSGQGVGSGSGDNISETQLKQNNKTASIASENLLVFFLAVEILKNVKDVSSTCFRTPDQDKNDTRCTIAPICFTPKGKVSKYTYIDYVKSHITTCSLRRRAAIVEVTTARGIGYFIESESRLFDGELMDSSAVYFVKTNDSTRIENHEFQTILLAFMNAKGVWQAPKNIGLPHLIGEAVRHPNQQKSDEKYVLALFEQLETRIYRI